MVLPFTRDLAAVDAETFAGMLVADLGMRALCVGEDFTLGRGRQGTVAELRAAGIDVIAVPLARPPRGAEKLSSTAIRAAIAAGVPARDAIRRARAGLAPLVSRRSPTSSARAGRTPGR